MRRLLSIAVVVLAAAVVAARSGIQAPEPEGEKKLIDLKSDLMGPIAPGDSVVFLVGNFAAQHNGAVITCDSAVRYSDMRIEFFGNVLINKNTTYIYGDRAEYDGELNEARVYSDIVKVVDGDATLYTYKFLFNTKKNIGEFADGGVMLNRENLLESVRGYYYADTKELIAVDRVEMRNDEYELKGDSVVYNMATDNAFFFDRTNIWNKDGDYLYADRGSYDKADTLYIVTRNGYILTEKQEIWSDSLHYYRAEDHVILRRDLQLDDAEHKVIAFGDYGEYWKEPGNAFLTRRPAVVSYDLSQGDSLFMRADSMYLFTINENALRRAAAAAKADSLARLKTDFALLGTPHHPAGELPEGRPAADSLGSPRVPAVGPGSPEDAAGPDSLARREERRLAARKLKAESKLRARQARAARKGKVIPVDSTALREIDSLIARNDREMDSLLLQMADSLAADSLAMRIPADSVDSLTDSADSVYRLMKGFRNVRIFRSDFQAVCDSMTAISTDSTIHLYINPVLWNQGNQITSDVMDIFTENQQITRAEFIGTPMMVSQLDTVHYNQVAGKQMTAWFRDNQIYRNDVNGNAQTIYYMQDGEPPQITGMGVIESGDCSFYIEDKQVVTIVYRKDPDWNIYPMDKIPADQELYLKGFKWEGARRPTQGAVFDRRVRPSQREEKSHLAHPDFPLLKALEERKKRLIEERRWADRNDQVDAATVEWMRALGFEVGQPRESGPKL